MNYFRKSLLLIACLTLWSTGSLSADDRYSQSADGMTVYIGILPAEMIREHRVIHQGCNDPLVSAHPTPLMPGVPGVPHSPTTDVAALRCSTGSSG